VEGRRNTFFNLNATGGQVFNFYGIGSSNINLGKQVTVFVHLYSGLDTNAASGNTKSGGQVCLKVSVVDSEGSHRRGFTQDRFQVRRAGCTTCAYRAGNVKAAQAQG